LEDLDSDVNVNSAWETIRENIKVLAKESLGYFELKKHKLWFEERYSKILDQRKQAKPEWLQYPREINGNNMNNIKRVTARKDFRNEKKTISEKHC
jgi:restriction endonuclease S subunit